MRAFVCSTLYLAVLCTIAAAVALYAPSKEADMQPFRDPLVLLLLVTAGATAFFFVYMTA